MHRHDRHLHRVDRGHAGRRARWSTKDLSPNDLARGLATDGLSAVLASFTNSFPDTAFAENVGLVGLTGIRSRWVVTICGVFLLILGLIPKLGQIIADLPGPVIGGAATVMFAMVTAVGIQTLHKVNFEGNHNLLIVATSLAVGLIPAFDPTFYGKFPKNFQMIFGSSITATVIVVFILNLVFNHWTFGRPPEGSPPSRPRSTKARSRSTYPRVTSTCTATRPTRRQIGRRTGRDRVTDPSPRCTARPADARPARTPRPTTRSSGPRCANAARPTSWIDRIIAGRPYRDRAALGAASDAATADLDDTGLAEALAGHPRIGERPAAHAARGRARSRPASPPLPMTFGPSSRPRTPPTRPASARCTSCAPPERTPRSCSPSAVPG